MSDVPQRIAINVTNRHLLAHIKQHAQQETWHIPSKAQYKAMYKLNYSQRRWHPIRQVNKMNIFIRVMGRRHVWIRIFNSHSCGSIQISPLWLCSAVSALYTEWTMAIHKATNVFPISFANAGIFSKPSRLEVFFPSMWIIKRLVKGHCLMLSRRSGGSWKKFRAQGMLASAIQKLFKSSQHPDAKAVSTSITEPMQLQAQLRT